MRVLHVYSGNLYGGVEAMLSTLAARRGLCPEMEPHFGLCFEGRLKEELLSCGAPVHMLGQVRVRRPWTLWLARRRLAALLGRERFDVVVCHSAWPQAIFGPVVRSARLPLVFYASNISQGRHWIERWARRTPPDLAVAAGPFIAETVPNLYPNVPREILYPPVTLRSMDFSSQDGPPLRNRFNTPEGSVTIIQVSRLERWKGQALHLEALARLRDIPEWVCWMAGGPQRPVEARYLEELKMSAVRLGIADRVRFLGERTDVPRLLAAADIFCQPNTQPEPFGIAFVEALARGMPVVTAAAGGALEIIDPTCGILVPPNDVESLAAALQTLIVDRALRTRLGAAGPARADQLCGVERQLNKLHAVLEGLVLARRPK